MIYQNDPRIQKACPELWHYGCGMMSLAFYREKYEGHLWKAQELIDAWNMARKLNIISGDLNGDGDTDDGGECEIQDWTRLCKVLGVSLRNIPGHYSPNNPIIQGHFTICSWYNPNTKFTHFVVGSKRPVEFDPIAGGSRTVREGYPAIRGIRVFETLS